MTALAASLVLGLALLSNPAFDPPISASDPGGCLVGPLNLTLGDLGRMGDVSRRVGKQSCYVGGLPGDLYGYERPMTVARTTLGAFTLFGEELGLALDVDMLPSDPLLVYGTPYALFTVPALILPEPWRWVIDDASHVAVAVGGAALLAGLIAAIASR